MFVGISFSFDCFDLNVFWNFYIMLNMRVFCCWGNGNIGFLFLIFILVFGLVFLFVWYNFDINFVIWGVVRFYYVEFVYFGIKCGCSSVVIISNFSLVDVFYLVYIKGIFLYNVDNDRLFYILFFNIGWINFGDCVDMDCDGYKYVLIKDEDGSFIGVFGGSVIVKVEFEWNGNFCRGFGKSY